MLEDQHPRDRQVSRCDGQVGRGGLGQDSVGQAWVCYHDAMVLLWPDIGCHGMGMG